jgi:hypothetical protein
MQKQATQLIAGDRIKVSDLHLDTTHSSKATASYAKVIRVDHGPILTHVKVAGIGWGSVPSNRPVRVHRASNRSANLRKGE